MAVGGVTSVYGLQGHNGNAGHSSAQEGTAARIGHVAVVHKTA